MYVLYCVWSLKIIKILIENPGFFFLENLQVSVVMASVLLLTWVDDDNSDSMDQQSDSDDQTETGNAENSKQADNKVSYRWSSQHKVC